MILSGESLLQESCLRGLASRLGVRTSRHTASGNVSASYQWGNGQTKNISGTLMERRHYLEINMKHIFWPSPSQSGGDDIPVLLSNKESQWASNLPSTSWPLLQWRILPGDTGDHGHLHRPLPGFLPVLLRRLEVKISSTCPVWALD